MCGIAGILAHSEDVPPADLDTLRRMAGALAHRGPDEFGYFRDRTLGLAHTRVSIIDLSSGQQPQCNEDGSLWIVFNGEIFNYVELRGELVARGHTFRTQSDTEVALHAFEEWGDGCFERFNGQFAIALWNQRTRELVLARDRFGERPLFCCEHAGRLYFASEVKAIFAAAPGVPRSIDVAALSETLTFWTTLAPRTIFTGVDEVRPAHARHVRGFVSEERPYWQPRYPTSHAEEFAGTLEEAALALRAALREATRLRLTRSDVPVGSYLSGGLDSSIIAALGTEATAERLRTFSLRFADAEYDETGYQRQMVQRLGTEHAEILLDAHQIADSFPDVIWHIERPILRTAPAPLFLLSGLVHASGIKVVLTGEGADEMLAGYDLFREAKVRRFWARRPESRWRPRLLERLYPYLTRSPVAQRELAKHFFGRNLAAWRSPGFGHGPRWETTSALKRLLSAGARDALRGRDPVAELLATLPSDFAGWSALAQDQYLETRTLLSGYLLSAQGDRVAMAHSVESRLPFLDNEVVALANSLPADYKLRVLDEKHVLKRAAAGLVPPGIVSRRKQPYRAPDALAFTTPPVPAWVEEVLCKSAITDSGFFDPDAVALLWRKCKNSRAGTRFSNADNMALVCVLSTQLLQEQLIRRPLEVRLPSGPAQLIDRIAMP
jgi:asparagine synthase (glutamine-hydrolysing)